MNPPRAAQAMATADARIDDLLRTAVFWTDRSSQEQVEHGPWFHPRHSRYATTSARARLDNLPEAVSSLVLRRVEASWRNQRWAVDVDKYMTTAVTPDGYRLTAIAGLNTLTINACTPRVAIGRGAVPNTVSSLTPD